MSDTKTKMMEPPIKRTELPEDVVTFLHKTYPPRKNKAGIEQEDRLDYLTSEHNFLESKNVRNLMKEANGRDAFALYWFLRHYMTKKLGWAIDITVEDKEDYNYKFLRFEISCFLKMTDEEIEESLASLEKNGLIIKVTGSDKRTYLTDLQQLYNYEYKNYTRIKNTEVKRQQRAKKKQKEQEEQEEHQAQETFQEQEAFQAQEAFQEQEAFQAQEVFQEQIPPGYGERPEGIPLEEWWKFEPSEADIQQVDGFTNIPDDIPEIFSPDDIPEIFLPDDFPEPF